MCNKMSDVRLSNASPTLERVDARQPDNVRPVRRRLFGRPDGEEIRRDLEMAMQEDAQRFRERYNFDPVNDRPLAAGDFVWEEDGDAPEYYRRPPHGNQRQDTQERDEDRSPGRDGSRKRPASGSGSCSTEQSSKNSRTNRDDDDDQSGGAVCLPVELSTKPEVQ